VKVSIGAVAIIVSASFAPAMAQTRISAQQALPQTVQSGVAGAMPKIVESFWQNTITNLPGIVSSFHPSQAQLPGPSIPAGSSGPYQINPIGARAVGYANIINYGLTSATGIESSNVPGNFGLAFASNIIGGLITKAISSASGIPLPDTFTKDVLSGAGLSGVQAGAAAQVAGDNPNDSPGALALKTGASSSAATAFWIAVTGAEILPALPGIIVAGVAAAAVNYLSPSEPPPPQAIRTVDGKLIMPPPDGSKVEQSVLPGGTPITMVTKPHGTQVWVTPDGMTTVKTPTADGGATFQQFKTNPNGPSLLGSGPFGRVGQAPEAPPAGSIMTVDGKLIMPPPDGSKVEQSVLPDGTPITLVTKPDGTEVWVTPDGTTTVKTPTADGGATFQVFKTDPNGPSLLGSGPFGRVGQASGAPQPANAPTGAASWISSLLGGLIAVLPPNAPVPSPPPSPAPPCNQPPPPPAQTACTAPGAKQYTCTRTRDDGSQDVTYHCLYPDAVPEAQRICGQASEPKYAGKWAEGGGLPATPASSSGNLPQRWQGTAQCPPKTYKPRSLEDVYFPPIQPPLLASLQPPEFGAASPENPTPAQPPEFGAASPESPPHLEPAPTPGKQASLPNPAPQPEPAPASEPSPGPTVNSGTSQSQPAPLPGPEGGLPSQPHIFIAPQPAPPAPPATHNQPPEHGGKIIDTLTPPQQPPNQRGGTGTTYGGTCSTVGGVTTCTSTDGRSCTTKSDFCDPAAPQAKPGEPKGGSGAKSAGQQNPSTGAKPGQQTEQKTAALPVKPAPAQPVAPQSKPLPPVAKVEPTPKPLPPVAKVEPTPKPLPPVAKVEPTPKPLPPVAKVEPTPKPLPPVAKVEPTPKPLPPVAKAEPTPKLPPPVAKVEPTPKPSPPAPPPPPLPQQTAKVGPPPVQPECRKKPVVYHPDRNDSVTIHVTIIGGAECSHTYKPLPGSTLQLTKASITSEPSHGEVGQSGPFIFTYRPNAGAKGSDRYKIDVCGTAPGKGSGCSHLTYQISLE
jgi:hypothetical protein